MVCKVVEVDDEVYHCECIPGEAIIILEASVCK